MAMSPESIGKVTFSENQERREDDPMPLLEDGHIKLLALSDEKTEEVSQLLRKARRDSNPLNTCANDNTVKTDVRRLAIDFVKRRFPPLEWMPKLTRQKLRADIVAGLTVGVMAIPQAMSYASIVGVPYVVGLYTAFVPVVVYAFVGTSRHLVVGPVAMESLLIASGLSSALTQEECPRWFASSKGKSQASMCPEAYTELVIATTFVVGLLEIASGIFGIGVLLRFMGKPVITGFTSGSAVVIMSSQLKEVLGIKIPNAETLIKLGEYFAAEIHHTKWFTVVLSLVFIAYLMFHKYITKHPRANRYIGWLGPLGPLIVVIIGGVMVANSPYLQKELTYVGYIPKGLPAFGLHLSSPMLGRVLPTAFGAFIVGDMEAIAIGKGLADKHGYTIDSTQELLAQGISNIIGALFSSFTATGSFSRSAVNDVVGAQTQLAALISALVVMLTLLLLTSWFYFVPKFVLAAIVITSVIPLVDLGGAIKLYRMSRKDFLVWFTAAMLVMFLGILEGLAAGVALSLAIVIYETAKPQIAILWRIPGTTIYRNIKQESSGTFIPNMFICRLGSSLYFANVVYVREKLRKYVEALGDVNRIEYLILEMTPVVTMDYSASLVLEGVVKDFRRKGIELAFAMVGPRVRARMARTGLLDVIGEQWFFNTVNEAVNFSLKHQRAKTLKDVENPMVDGDSDDNTRVPDSAVFLGAEVSISNDMHAQHTVVFVSLECDRPDAMTDIIRAFQDAGFGLKGANAEQFDALSWRHRYFIQNAAGGKLFPDEVSAIAKSLRKILDIDDEN